MNTFIIIITLHSFFLIVCMTVWKTALSRAHNSHRISPTINRLNQASILFCKIYFQRIKYETLLLLHQLMLSETTTPPPPRCHAFVKTMNFPAYFKPNFSISKPPFHPTIETKLYVALIRSVLERRQGDGNISGQLSARQIYVFTHSAMHSATSWAWHNIAYATI